MTGFRVNELGPGDKKREIIDYWAWMGPHVALAVDASFRDANTRGAPTHNELKDRVFKAKKIVEMLKNDFKWGRQRIADRLPALLRAELLKLKHSAEQEDKRKTFTPDQASASGVAIPRAATGALAVRLDNEFGKVEKDRLEIADPLDLAGPASGEIKMIETGADDEPVV